MTLNSRPDNAFDQTLADTAEDLDQIARDTLADETVQDALEDEGRDDAW